MARLAAVLLIAVSVTGCFKAVAMSSHGEKLYVYKKDKMYMCTPDGAGNVTCLEAKTHGLP